MAEPRNNEDMEILDPQERQEKSIQEEGDAVRGRSDEGDDIDPDSAEADIDRDDSVGD